jgi:hypothetical protein
MWKWLSPEEYLVLHPLFAAGFSAVIVLAILGLVFWLDTPWREL